jgi:formyl-CoA transferase
VVNLLPHQLERRRLTGADLSAINPDLVLVCVTSYGLSGPSAELPGSGTLGEAFAGLTHLTGDPDGKPMLSSVPLGDAVTGWDGAFGVLAACYERAHGGRGQVIDVNPVDSLLHIAAPALAEWESGSEPAGRLSGRLPGSPVRNAYRCLDGRWVAISCSTPRHLSELSELIDHPLDAADADDGSIDTAVMRWVGCHPRGEVLELLAARRVPVAPVHDAQTVQTDPHVLARQSIRSVASTELGNRKTPDAAPRFGNRHDDSAWRCPDVGEDNHQVLTDLLGLSPEDVAQLERNGVI